MPIGGPHFPLNRALREALDKSLDHLLLQPVRRLGVGEHVRSSFDSANCRLMQLAQLPQSRAPGSPPSGGRDDEFGST
jgi:hypothetical protein